MICFKRCLPKHGTVCRFLWLQLNRKFIKLFFKISPQEKKKASKRFGLPWCKQQTPMTLYKCAPAFPAEIIRNCYAHADLPNNCCQVSLMLWCCDHEVLWLLSYAPSPRTRLFNIHERSSHSVSVQGLTLFTCSKWFYFNSLGHYFISRSVGEGQEWVVSAL